MKHIYLYLSLSLFIYNCKAQDQVQNRQEPTTPEATEIWTPKPLTVKVNPETGIPSDAIVLFDGTDFENWISSKDSTKVQWELNEAIIITINLPTIYSDITSSYIKHFTYKNLNIK